MKNVLIALFLFLIACIHTTGQNNTETEIKYSKSDTVNVNNLNRLSEKLWKKSQFDSAIVYANKAQILAKKFDYRKGIADANHNLGVIYRNKGSYLQALQDDLDALKIYQELGDKKGTATMLGNIGVVYMSEGGNNPKALEYDFKALAIYLELGDKIGISRNLGNIGIAYHDMGNDAEALKYAKNSLQLHQEIEDNQGIAINLSSIGALYYKEKDLTTSLVYYFKALTKSREIGNKEQIAHNYGDIGSVYILQGKYKQAKAYLDSGLNLEKKIGEKEDLKSIYASLSALDTISGDYKTAFKDFETFIIYRDSIINDGNTKKIEQAQMNYTFDRKTDSAKAEQEKKDILAEAEKRKQDIVTWSTAVGLLVVLVFAGFVLRSLKITRKQKQVIEIKSLETEQQKRLIEEKNKDILDSITYAKRLQEAILPPISLIKKFFPQSFILYKPKDIVAGDFYWMERSGDNILIAAADCTGHGVPGALVSVVCSDALNRTLKEFRITNCGKILDKVTELVLETFEKSESNVQDGMDISLCCINTKALEVQWSGANNPLWYIQNGEMHEVRADKQPIGKYINSHPFHEHTIKLLKGDTIYLFTDGYADQFGGSKGKKFKDKQLQEVLLANESSSMEEQKSILERNLDEWKGNLEQVDDILVIGIRL
jgi:serine phosphatase RsbU (regulator of sigma subunit)